VNDLRLSRQRSCPKGLSAFWSRSSSQVGEEVLALFAGALPESLNSLHRVPLARAGLHELFVGWNVVLLATIHFAWSRGVLVLLG
jgi:hypothetical protein